ncbi:MAG: hypothetical protein C7B45_04395 [Sulfobacillus acidophilus]|uniref:Uncharacterized protein n=1 Tax=Sulfobacillus acidophilus TaxID=53633 RepID=A0A2T2WLB4_9FIRM|nr:MAG: hypothetical protein C7B45_04395 [Sulfobacillus acidophilus]
MLPGRELPVSCLCAKVDVHWTVLPCPLMTLGRKPGARLADVRPWPLRSTMPPLVLSVGPIHPHNAVEQEGFTPVNAKCNL